MSQDEILREVTAINKVGAKIGDEVNFELPDIIDIFATFRHLLWPFLIGLAVEIVMHALLKPNLLQLSIATRITLIHISAITSFLIVLGVLVKRGVIKRDSLNYTIEITSIITK